MMGKSVYLTLHTRVVVEGIAIIVTEFRDVSFQGRVSKRCGKFDLNKQSFFEVHKILEIPDKEHYDFIVNVFAYRYYPAFSMESIKMWVEITKICLIPPFDDL